MALYNLSKIQEALTVSDVATAANEYSQGVLYGFFMIGIFIVFLMAFKFRNDFDESLLVSSFICFVISGIATYGGFLNIIFPLTFLILTVMTGFWVWVTRR